MKKRLLVAFSLIPVIIVLASYAQTSGDTCPAGEPKCFKDLVPYSGHNISASQLPPNLCPEGCAGDNRRAIIIRFDSSWGSQTNSNIWQAVHCAAAAWNNATDGASPPNRTGYYFAIDQGGLLSQPVPDADITIIKDTPTEGLASCNVGKDHDLSIRRNVIRLDSVNGDLGVGAGLNMTASDLCGRVAHELGHLIGLAEVPNCRSIMYGANANGSRDVDTVQPNDVAQVNQNFNGATRGSCAGTTPSSGVAGEPIITPTPTPTPNPCANNDHDNDGWASSLCGGSDCDDNNASINPGAWEICGDGMDNDCQGGDELCFEGSSSTCDDGIDNDQDGFIDCEDPGCSHYGCVSGCSPSQFAMCQLLGGQGCVDGMCYTPVLIDMQGNGIQLTNAQNGVLFNVLPGHPAKLAWTLPDSDDAWLVLDRNGNGTIDSGEELFGNATPQALPPPGESKNGFLALAEYDTSAKGGNGDGLITASDAIFNSLQLWQDDNHNGISEPSELHNLSESGIATIECKYKESKRTDEYGNNFRYRAKVKDKRGEQVGRWAWDVFVKMLPR